MKNDESSCASNTTKERKGRHKNEIFYQKKRGIQRKAEQLMRSCDSEVFICVYKKDLKKVYTYQTSDSFSLEVVTDLILKEVQSSSFLKKNSAFENVCFDKVQDNVDQIMALQEGRQ